MINDLINNCNLWSYITFSRNPNITLDTIFKYKDKLKDKPMNLQYIVCINKNISKSDIIQLSEIHQLSSYRDVILPNTDEIIKYYDKLYQHRDITIEYIIDNPHIDWDWRILSRDPNLSIEDILTYSDEWHYSICTNPNLTISTILKYSNKPWYWELISMNKGITMDDIINNIDKPWRWDCVARNPNFTFDIVLKHIDKPWEWVWISEHKNITMSIILKHLDKPWEWGSVSKNPSITINDVIKYPNFYWNWNYISEKPDLTIDIALQLKKPWYWYSISRNPNITVNDILKHWDMPWTSYILENPNMLPTTFPYYRSVKKFKHLQLVQRFETKFKKVLNLPLELSELIIEKI